jgi:hypothetical protein
MLKEEGRKKKEEGRRSFILGLEPQLKTSDPKNGRLVLFVVIIFNSPDIIKHLSKARFIL